MDHLPAWALFAIPATCAVAITAAILVAGPYGGFVVAGLAAIGILLAAAGTGSDRSLRPRTPSEAAPIGLLAGVVATIALAVAGIVVIAVADGTAQAIGWGLVALSGTLAMCLIFLEVGLSEERDRERAQQGPPAG